MGLENIIYKNENIEWKYLKVIRKNQFLKAKNSLLESWKYFIELKDREVKKKEREEIIFKLIMVFIDYMDKFE